MSNPNRDNRSLHIFLILGVIPVIWAALMVAPFISEGMLANSEYLVMLNQAPTDRAELAKLLNISDTQLSYITNVGFGKGLLKCGSSILRISMVCISNTSMQQISMCTLSTNPS